MIMADWVKAYFASCTSSHNFSEFKKNICFCGSLLKHFDLAL